MRFANEIDFADQVSELTGEEIKICGSNKSAFGAMQFDVDQSGKTWLFGIIVHRFDSADLEFWRCSCPAKIAHSDVRTSDLMNAALVKAKLPGVTAPRHLRRAVKISRVRPEFIGVA
ncbi:hypothetical protein [Tateyamaria sp. Alg231-49]|uniref:hypothetical protein n=1 Tax=Tateyamaria sp. Alg231-49 TaxID=1922219 RepID=UPI000D5611C8|nr:hypothetical protein [Tateyamaria sp. Alg231-49]